MLITFLSEKTARVGIIDAGSISITKQRTGADVYACACVIHITRCNPVCPSPSTQAFLSPLQYLSHTPLPFPLPFLWWW